MKKILLIILIGFSLCGCGTKQESKNPNGELRTIMENEEHIILDVRTKEEYMEEHIKGAINIPYDQLDENSSLDKDKIIFVYCFSGGRSKIAYGNLTTKGYIVYDLGALNSIDLPKERDNL